MNAHQDMNKQVTVNEWVAMFHEIGLNQAQMEQWHKVFEARHPAGHQSFLEWLGLTPDKIDEVRAKSR
jgi:crotonobetainyl-CoA:carnitine CoA-transferase CaiB-like acyl-CoA transferase